jgi:hypothetical protein
VQRNIFAEPDDAAQCGEENNEISVTTLGFIWEGTLCHGRSLLVDNSKPKPGIEAFDAVLDVHDGGPLRLAVDLNNMHLLNEVIGAVI